MAAEYVAGKQRHVHREDQRPQPNPEMSVEPERLHRIDHQKKPDDVRQPQEISMEVLEYKRQIPFSEIILSRLADSARRWIGPERFVVRSAVVIAGEPKQTGDPKDQECRREREERRIPGGFAMKPCVRRIAPDFRRIEGRDI